MEIRIKRQANGKIHLYVDGKPHGEDMDDPMEIAAEVGREKEKATRLIEHLLSDNPASIIGESVVEYYERE